MTPIIAAQAVALEFNVLPSDIMGPSRRRAHVDARKALVWLLRTKTALSWAAIGGVIMRQRPTAIAHYHAANRHVTTCKHFRKHMNNLSPAQ